ncbi:thioredoxin family protein [Isosphaeraceae bacterium EP7]
MISLLLLSVCPNLLGAEPTPIAWRTDLARAQAEALSSNRLLWIQFTGPWCQNCHKMDEETFRDPRVRSRAGAQFIPVTLSTETHEQYALDLGLSVLPSTVIVTPSGQIIARQEGFAEAEAFDGFLAGSLSADGRPSKSPLPDPAESRLAAIKLDGVCPVSLVSDRKIVPGRELMKASYEGSEYRFANAQARSKFLSDPSRFVPRNEGNCPVNLVDKGDLRRGDPRFGLLYRGHLYTFADEPSRAAFLKNPTRYADIDVADRGFCPHCWKNNRTLVRGLPKFSASRSGLRYWFPDSLHLSAFLFRDSSTTARR